MTKVLDLRQFPESAQKRNIAELLTVLQDGESFTLVNGTDPKILLEGLTLEAPQNLEFEYLEQGPQAWRLKLTKLMAAEDKEGCCGCCGG